MSKIVIGMVGKAGSGKDTVGNYICEHYGFVKMALADPLKASVKEMFCLDDFTVYDRAEREKPLPDFPDWSVRKLFQYIGTDLMRKQFDDALWVKLLNKRIKNSEHSRIIVTDVRFPNEIVKINELAEKDNYHTTFIKVVRPGHVGHNVGIANHESEKYDLPAEYTIMNSATLEVLYDEARLIVSEILRDYEEENVIGGKD